MTVLSVEKRAELETRKTEYEARLDDAYDALEIAVSGQSGKTKSYKFDSGEGMQSATLRSFEEIRSLIEFLESRLDHIDRRLRGALNVNLNVRRKAGSAFGRRNW